MVTVSTLGGTLGLLLLVMIAAVILGTCIVLCIHHKRQNAKATGNGMWDSKPYIISVLSLHTVGLLYKSIMYKCCQLLSADTDNAAEYDATQMVTIQPNPAYGDVHFARKDNRYSAPRV